MARSLITPNRFFVQPISEQFANVPDFKPPRTRNQAEAARRKQNPAGTLILEQQLEGIEIVKRGLRLAGSIETAAAWSGVMACSLLGAGRYHLDGTGQMRYAKVPILGAKQPADRPDSGMLVEASLRKLETTADFAGHLLVAHRIRLSGTKYREITLATGRHLVDAAFLLANIGNGDHTADPANEVSNREAQELAVDTCKQVVQTAGEIGIETQAYPTVAQLTDFRNPFPLEIWKAAPDQVADLYQKAA